MLSCVVSTCNILLLLRSYKTSSPRLQHDVHLVDAAALDCPLERALTTCHVAIIKVIPKAALGDVAPSVAVLRLQGEQRHKLCTRQFQLDDEHLIILRHVTACLRKLVRNDTDTEQFVSGSRNARHSASCITETACM